MLTIAVAQTSIALAIVVVVATVLVVGTIALIGSAASGIFTASLYRYATKGEPGTNFRRETMSAAFRSKNAAPQTPASSSRASGAKAPQATAEGPQPADVRLCRAQQGRRPSAEETN